MTFAKCADRCREEAENAGRHQLRIDERQERRGGQPETHPQAGLNHRRGDDDERHGNQRQRRVETRNGKQIHQSYPAALWRMFSGSHVASWGKAIRMKTMRIMIRHIGNAARAT